MPDPDFTITDYSSVLLVDYSEIEKRIFKNHLPDLFCATDNVHLIDCEKHQKYAPLILEHLNKQVFLRIP